MPRRLPALPPLLRLSSPPHLTLALVLLSQERRSLSRRTLSPASCLTPHLSRLRDVCHQSSLFRWSLPTCWHPHCTLPSLTWPFFPSQPSSGQSCQRFLSAASRIPRPSAAHPRPQLQWPGSPRGAGGDLTELPFTALRGATCPDLLHGRRHLKCDL